MFHTTPHTTHYTKAIAFIRSHGHFATITLDGLLATSWVGGKGPDEDAWCEEPQVFEVDEMGMVKSRDVRNWLGY